MSIHCMERVLDHSTQKGSPLLLLLVMANYADENGFAFPGGNTLARRTRISRRQVLRIVAHLQSAHELLVFTRTGSSNLYIVLAGTCRDRLALALQKAARFGAFGDQGAIPDRLLEDTCDKLSHLERGPVTTCHQGEDNLSPPCDTAMSPDPSLSVIDPSVERKWEKTLALLESQMTKATFDQNLRGSRAIALDGERLMVQLRNPHALGWVENRLARVVARALPIHLPGITARFVPPPQACLGPRERPSPAPPG